MSIGSSLPRQSESATAAFPAMRRLTSGLAQHRLFKREAGSLGQSSDFHHEVVAESFDVRQESRGVRAQLATRPARHVLDPAKIALDQIPGLPAMLISHLI